MNTDEKMIFIVCAVLTAAVLFMMFPGMCVAIFLAGAIIIAVLALLYTLNGPPPIRAHYKFVCMHCIADWPNDANFCMKCGGHAHMLMEEEK
jgi:hypothetical protein